MKSKAIVEIPLGTLLSTSLSSEGAKDEYTFDLAGERSERNGI